MGKGPRRRIKDVAKRMLRVVFEWGQLLGVDLLPRHFYSEVPDIPRLRRTSNWRRPYPFRQIPGGNIHEQLGELSSWLTGDVREHLATFIPHVAAIERQGEDGYGPIESDVLFAFIATRQPPAILQIGCGVSTAVILDAADWGGYQPTVTCIEPYPSGYLKDLERDGRIRLITQGAESISVDLLDTLNAGSLFFVDSSHTLGPAGEVTRIILEMLPRLKAGTFAHFHDIYFPFDYSPTLLKSDLFFAHESALLQALLTTSGKFSLAACMSMLHHAEPSALTEMLPRYVPAVMDAGLVLIDGHFPSSAYIRVVA